MTDVANLRNLPHLNLIQGTFSPSYLLALYSTTKTTILKVTDLHIANLSACIADKENCQLVYRTELGKVVTTQGIIRDTFRKANRELLILENGLPIPTEDLIHIRRMFH